MYFSRVCEGLQYSRLSTMEVARRQPASLTVIKTKKGNTLSSIYELLFPVLKPSAKKENWR